jgi:hypothetical protein
VSSRYWGSDQTYCADAARVMDLKNIILAAGLALPLGSSTPSMNYRPVLSHVNPSNVQTTNTTLANATQLINPKSYSLTDSTSPHLVQPLVMPPQPPTLAAASTILDTPDFTLPFDTAAFNAFFDFPNDNEDDDADFLPGSSPRAESEDEDRTPKIRGRGEDQGKHKRRTRGALSRVEEEDEDDEEDEDEFEDDDVEDEDLFLPIEDVEVPGGFKEKKENGHDAMKSLGVEDQGQLADLIEKVVEAGKTKEGVTPDVLEKLKVLIGLAGRGANGAMG